MIAVSLFAFGLRSAASPQQQPDVKVRGARPVEPANSVDTAWRVHRNYALLFATNKYESWPSLANPIPDAKAIAKVLKDDYGFDTEVIENPSLNAIITKLRTYGEKQFQGGDQLLIFFAGHGAYEEDDQEGYIVASDSKSESEDPNRLSYESYSQLQVKINSIPAKHLLLILDACFGGAFDRRLSEADTRGNELYSDIPVSELFAQKVELKTRKYLTSGGKTYAVPDGLPGQHSPFVRNLLRSLTSDGGSKGYLTFEDIQADIGTTRPEPYGGDWGSNDIGSDFFFLSRKLLVRATSTESETPSVPSIGASLLPQARYSIAVLGLRDLSARPEDSWISSALAEELTTELLGGGLRPVADEDVAKAETDLTLPELSGYSRDTLAKLQKILGVDWIVSGSYITVRNPDGNRIHVDLRVQDVHSGQIIAGDSEEGTESELSAVVKQAGNHIRRKLGIQISPDEGTRSADAALPSNTDASKFYAEGLEKLRSWDLLAARDLLKQAVAADPKSALAHAALAEAWFELGYDRHATQESKDAFDLSASLPMEKRYVIEGDYRQRAAEWSRAVDIYSELWREYPEDIDYALELATAQSAAGKEADALSTLDKLRETDQHAADDPRVDYEEAIVADSVSDRKRQASAAVRAAEKASRQGSRLLAAQAYWQECSAFFNLGDSKNAEDACQKANQAADYAGGREVKARSLTMLTRTLEGEGKISPSEAMEQFENIVEMARQIGSQRDIIGALINLANIQATEGQVAEAKKNEQEAIGIAREIGDESQLLDLQNNLADDLNTQGDYPKARASYEDALMTARELGNPGGISGALENLGVLSLKTGDLKIAERDVQQALVTARDAHLESATVPGLNDLGDIQMAKGDLREARKNYEDALKLSVKSDDHASIAISKLSLADLELEDGNAGQSQILAQQAVEEFQAEKDVDNEAGAHDTLARALILQGKLKEAQAEIENARKLVQDCATKISVAVTAARLEAQRGKLEESRQDLNSQLAEASARNLLALQFEIRLALAETKSPSDLQSKEALLAALERDARSSGYMIYANKAEHLRMALAR